MAVHFHSLKISDIKKETADCVSISFDIPPGLEPQFAFREGQNITVKSLVKGQEIRRSYSICSAPYEKQLRVAVKKVDGGLFSAFANDHLKAGDQLEVLPPTGKFNARLSTGKSHYLAIAAGSGITPIISIIKHSLLSNPACSFTLLYGNRTRNSIIFFDELEALKNKYMERFNLVNILSRERTDTDVFYGRIDAKKLAVLEKLIPLQNFNEIYLCGPEELVFATSAYFTEQGFDPSHIHFELFTTPGQKHSATMQKKESGFQGAASKVNIRLDGRSFDFNLAFNGVSILDAALQQGADLPYACKGGVCATCRAKLVSGEVEMDVNYALEKEEIEQGFILTCQSHPRSETVSVDFDIK